MIELSPFGQKKLSPRYAKSDTSELYYIFIEFILVRILSHRFQQGWKAAIRFLRRRAQLEECDLEEDIILDEAHETEETETETVVITTGKEVETVEVKEEEVKEVEVKEVEVKGKTGGADM